jgi:ribosomal protein S14
VAIELNTVRALHEHGYRLSVFCRPCGRHVFWDLAALIAAGEGARAVVGLRVRCQVCGRPGELSILWDRPLRGGNS